jgi:hypothetical protein
VRPQIQTPEPQKKERKKEKGMKWGLGMVVHVCNPSYLGCKDIEDHGSRPARQKS